MKLLRSRESWAQWIKGEDGRFADTEHPVPKKFPCYGYMEVVSWAQTSQRPVYLYAHDLDAMSIELIAAAQRM
jgi:hypothetical protein